MTDRRTSVGDLAGAVELARSVSALPAYASAWSAAADEIDASSFSSLAPASKSDLISAVTGDDPFGGRLGVTRREIHSVFVAPGPLYLPLAQGDFNALIEVQARALAASGINSGDIVDQTVGYQWVIGGTILHRALERIGCTVVPGGPGQTDLHAQSIAALSVTAIVAFPSFLEHLLNRAGELGLTLPLRVASVAGEMSDRSFKPRMESDFGIVVRERYATAEAGPLAYECEIGAGLHLDPSVYVEFIDPDNLAPRAIDDPALKEIVVTSQIRAAFPVVRFRTGDLVEDLETGPCECGRSTPRIRRIVGRSSTIPRVKGMFVVPQHVEDLLQKFNVQSRFQLRIDRPDRLDRLTVAIERPEISADDLIALGDEINSALRMRAELELVDSLPADAAVVEDRRGLV
jgi:phenylacetate-CoA ligase